MAIKKEEPITALSFEFLTPFFDSLSNFFGFGGKINNKVVSLLKLKPFERILDLGCGTGSLLIIAKGKKPNVDMTGVDLDEKILKIAQKKISKKKLNIKLIKASAEKLPFPDSSFDVVVSTLVFHHLPAEIKKEALKEVHRVLKKNGRFLLVDFGKFTGFSRILYCLLVVLNIPEAKTLRDNIEGKIPEFLKQADFKFSEISKRYMGIQYLLAKKVKMWYDKMPLA